MAGPPWSWHVLHRLVLCADADAALDQMLLEIFHIVWRGRIWRPPQPSRKTLAGTQMAGLGCRTEIAPRHIGNYTLTKGRRWGRMLNVLGNVLCQSRQNHLDQQHTLNIKTRVLLGTGIIQSILQLS